MPNAAQVSAEAISALLTGLAGALTDAQELMSELPPTDGFGRALPTYQIPHLDFKFEIETVRKTSSAGGFLGFQLRPASTAPSETISSTISGRLVAVPPNGGLPQTQILITQTESDLQIRLVNSAGEVLANAAVELEFDAAASAALYETALEPNDRLALLESQQVVTDTEGLALAAIQRSSIPVGKSAVILVRAGGSVTRIAVNREVSG